MINQNNNTAKIMIIPVFIMNDGCPHRCIFCNQSVTAGNYSSILTKDRFEKIVNSYLNSNSDNNRRIEIAFYGGNFTGLRRLLQENYLSWANYYFQKGLIQGIRISTRPDYINDEILSLLNKYNVSVVELGAQSFVDDVLAHAQRGHDAACIEKAVKLIKEYSILSSLHLMIGLPKDTNDGFLYSLKKTVELKPDMVRINPTLVLKNTTLVHQYLQGDYTPLSLKNAVDQCRIAFEILSAAGITIIRFGLHITEEMKIEGSVLAGPMHESLGSVVLSSFFYHKTLELLNNIPQNVDELHLKISSSDESVFRGWRNQNVSSIKNLYPRAQITIESSPLLNKGDIYFSFDSSGPNFVNIYNRNNYPSTEAQQFV
jgi:histone acetyltransferase (RNA polymerase elongator complex component)